MPIVHALRCKEPNCCMHVYKARRSKLSKVRLWAFYDAGTLRITDCFVTNNTYELLNVDDTNIELILEENIEDPYEDLPTEEAEGQEVSPSDWY